VARLDAADRYEPVPFDGDVVVIRGTESVAGSAQDDALGWRRFVKGEVKVEWAPGSHESVLRGEGARAVAAIVERHAAPGPGRRGRSVGQTMGGGEG
jgi:pyochelin synthetase